MLRKRVMDEAVPLEAWRPQGEVRSGRTGRRLLQNPETIDTR